MALDQNVDSIPVPPKKQDRPIGECTLVAQPHYRLLSVVSCGIAHPRTPYQWPIFHFSWNFENWRTLWENCWFKKQRYLAVHDGREHMGITTLQYAGERRGSTIFLYPAHPEHPGPAVELYDIGPGLGPGFWIRKFLTIFTIRYTNIEWHDFEPHLTGEFSSPTYHPLSNLRCLVQLSLLLSASKTCLPGVQCCQSAGYQSPRFVWSWQGK